jgi:hypothetical protein
MPLSPPLMLEVGIGIKSQLLLFLNIVGPFFGSNKELGGASKTNCKYKAKMRITTFVLGLQHKPEMIMKLSQRLC